MPWIFILLCALGCDAPERKDERIEVVCTTGMVADLARNIGGDRISVVGMMGPGVDPHYYKASQGDLAKLTAADLILFNGLFLEGKMEDIFAKMARSKQVLALAEQIPEERLLRPPEFEGNFDPHIWFDVSLWAQTIEPVVARLSAIDPDGASIYRQNGAALPRAPRRAEPMGRRAGRVAAGGQPRADYGSRRLWLLWPSLRSGGRRPARHFHGGRLRGQRRHRLVDLIVERQVKAIFVESSVPVRSIEAVREGCLDRGFQVEIGGTLYSDAMGAAGSGADTYVGMVESNVNTIVGALR